MQFVLHLIDLIWRTELRYTGIEKKLDWGRIKQVRYMHYSQAEKMEIIGLVGSSDLSVSVTLRKLGIQRSTFYKWYDMSWIRIFDQYIILGGCRMTVNLK